MGGVWLETSIMRLSFAILAFCISISARARARARTKVRAKARGRERARARARARGCELAGSVVELGRTVHTKTLIVNTGV